MRAQFIHIYTHTHRTKVQPKPLSDAQLLAASPNGTQLNKVDSLLSIHYPMSSLFRASFFPPFLLSLAFNSLSLPILPSLSFQVTQIIIYRSRVPVDLSCLIRCPELRSLSLTNCGNTTSLTGIMGCQHLTELTVNVRKLIFHLTVL